MTMNFLTRTGYRTLVALLLVFSIAACAGKPPASRTVPNSRDFDNSYDEVWTAVIDSIAARGLPISTLEKDSGIIAVNNITYNPTDADEGELGSLEVILQRRASANILVRELENGKTRAQMNLQLAAFIRSGNGSLAFPHRTRWQPSVSNGNIERRVLNGIQDRLKNSVYQGSNSNSSQVSSTRASGTGNADARWIGQGNADACGNTWAIDLAVSRRNVTGTLWFSEVTYDLSGNVDGNGIMNSAVATKS